VRSLREAVSGATRIANTVRSLIGEPSYGQADWMKTDPLGGLKHLAEDIRSRAPRLGPQADAQSDEWRALLRRVGRFTVQLFEPAAIVVVPGRTSVAGWVVTAVRWRTRG
jgi:hypothetical protein